jgi:hypothetical protein
MDTHTYKTTVLILGCFHADSSTAPQYTAKLKAAIIEVMPPVLCVELSPEQLRNDSPHGAKKEYKDVILPLAEKYDMTVVPIDPPQIIGDPLIQEMRRAERVPESDETGKVQRQLMEKLAELTAARWYVALEETDCFDYVQAREFDILHYEPWYALEKEYFPESWNIWNVWNEHVANNIGNTIKQYPGAVILVTIGLDHKYWLWNRLKDRNDIILHNLSTYRAIRTNRPTG